MRTILRESNLDLLREVERLSAALAATAIVAELTAFRDRVLVECASPRDQLRRNLRDLDLGPDGILPEILSETQRLACDLQLYNQRLAGPALRGLEADRLSLRVIGWLHSVHEETKSVPAAMSTEEFSIWPAPPRPVVSELYQGAARGAAVATGLRGYERAADGAFTEGETVGPTSWPRQSPSAQRGFTCRKLLDLAEVRSNAGSGVRSRAIGIPNVDDEKNTVQLGPDDYTLIPIPMPQERHAEPEWNRLC